MRKEAISQRRTVKRVVGSRTGPSVYSRLIPSFLIKTVVPVTYESVSNSETGRWERGLLSAQHASPYCILWDIGQELANSETGIVTRDDEEPAVTRKLPCH